MATDRERDARYWLDEARDRLDELDAVEPDRDDPAYEAWERHRAELSGAIRREEASRWR